MNTKSPVVPIIIIIVVAVIAYFGYRALYATPVENADTSKTATTTTQTPVAQKDDLIKLDTPVENGMVSSPLLVSGSARGNWYFEGSFPVSIEDDNGTVLGQGIATAQGDWMTTEYVPFTALLVFKVGQAQTNTGKLILKKDNPSGDPERDNALVLPIVLKQG